MSGGILDEGLTFGPRQAVMDQDRQIRSKARSLLLPVADHRGRADNERWLPVIALPFTLNECKGLNRFPQSHIVCQASAQSRLTQKCHPRIPAHLIRPQSA